MFVTSTNYYGPSLRKPAPRHGFTLIELLVVLCVIAVLVAFLLPARRGSREAPRRTQCRNNLKQLGLALHNYHDAFGAFPPAYTVDADGKPLHSWRTLLLPYLDHKPLYDRLDLSKPWDDPVNAEVFKSDIPVYRCPSLTTAKGRTTYVTVVTPHSALRAESSPKIKDFSDGTTNTLMVMEVDSEHAVPWMSPQDADEAWLQSIGPKSKFSHNGGCHALFADGAVRFLSVNVPLETRLAIITIDGGETVGDF